MSSWHLLNDTSSYHAGSAATVAALTRRLPGSCVPRWERADLVVLNGEGTLHHGEGERLLGDLSLAIQNGKRCALVNTVWQEMGEHWAALLRDVDVLTVRDPWSRDLMRDQCGRVPALNADLALSDLSFPSSPGPFAGEVVLGDVGASGRVGLWNELSDLHRSRRVSLFGGASFQSVVDSLAGCSLYLTGQWHGMLAAAWASVPFAVVSSNSWKIESFLSLSGLRGLGPLSDDEMLTAARDGLSPVDPDLFLRFSVWLRELRSLAPFPDLVGEFV